MEPRWGGATHEGVDVGGRDDALGLTSRGERGDAQGEGRGVGAKGSRASAAPPAPPLFRREDLRSELLPLECSRPSPTPLTFSET